MNFSIPVSIQMCNFSMNAALFRCFAGGSPAFLSVWGGQTERETPLADFKLHAARFGVCVGLAVPLILAGYMYAVCALSRLTRGAEEVPFS